MVQAVCNVGFLRSANGVLMLSADFPVLRHTLLAALGLTACTGSINKPDGEPDPTDLGPETTDTSDTGSPVVTPCLDGESLLDRDGAPSGYVMCADGAINRTDSHVWASGACGTDADCGDGMVCIGDDIASAGSAESYCIEANCETNADCDSGECGLSSYDDGCGPVVSLHCRDEDTDECRADADCPESENQCVTTYWSEEVWVCAGYDCAIGRPLMVGTGRQHAVVAGIEVAPGSVRAIPGLDGETRGALAAWWAHVAQLEHASVASFARVTLELMSLGAPPDILRDVQSAASDEIVHAQLAFEQASRFSGITLGPAPLSTAGVVPRVGAEAVLKGLIAEACVGETVGVAEARIAREGCTDPALQGVFTQIIDDETRHAALAWRTLAWLLDRHPELVDVAEDSFTEAIAAVVSSDTVAVPSRPMWGLLGSNERSTAREEAVRKVVLPCAQALLDRARLARTKSAQV